MIAPVVEALQVRIERRLAKKHRSGIGGLARCREADCQWAQVKPDSFRRRLRRISSTNETASGFNGPRSGGTHIYVFRH
jgi:hypothetical protein